MGKPRRDKDATWRSLGTLCRERDSSKRRLLHELQNGLPNRTIPPGHVIDWHDPGVSLDVECSEVSFCGSGILSLGRVTVGIEVLAPPETKEKPRAVGRPPDYPVEIIRQIARDYITVYGLPQSQAMLREKVSDECERNGFDVPGETRLKQLVDPIYKERARARGHKVTN